MGVAAPRATTEDWEELALGYARFRRGANGRLRRCADYWRRGMRIDATHSAECQSNLLHLVTALRVPGALRQAKLRAPLGLPVALRPPNDLDAEFKAAAHFHFSVDLRNYHRE